MGFFPKKNDFWLQNKKFAANFGNRRVQTVRPRTFSTSNQETEAYTEEIRSRRICRYDRGLEIEASLETRVHSSCPWDSALSLRTVQKVLSLRTEQHSNAVTCKVCARFCCLLRATGLSGCIFTLGLLGVFKDIGTYDSKQLFYSPTEIHPEICENCRCAFLYTFCVALFYFNPNSPHIPF